MKRQSASAPPRRGSGARRRAPASSSLEVALRGSATSPMALQIVSDTGRGAALRERAGTRFGLPGVAPCDDGAR